MADVADMVGGSGWFKAGEMDRSEILVLTVKSAELRTRDKYGTGGDTGKPAVEERLVQLQFDEDDRMLDVRERSRNLRNLVDIAGEPNTDAMIGCEVALSVTDTNFGPGVLLEKPKTITRAGAKESPSSGTEDDGIPF